MKTVLGCGIALLAATFAQGAAVATVDGVTVDAAARCVKVAYTLMGGDAIVTASFTTNGVPVAAERSTALVGDVNRRVGAGAASFTWYAQSDLGNLPACEVGVELALWSAANPPDYMAVNLAAASNVTYYASVDALPGGIGADRWRVSELLMRRIRAKGATFPMGKNSVDTSRIKEHAVTLTNDYYIGVFELTQGQLVNISGLNVSYDAKPDLKGWIQGNWYTNAACAATRPADNLLWRTLRGSSAGYAYPASFAVDDWSILGKLRAHCGLEIDLPTEAMWEFACRGGSESQCFYTDLGLTRNDVSRNAHNGGRPASGYSPRDVADDQTTARVGSYAPNAYGLYDMYGNVNELCLDRYAALTDGRAAVDPLGDRTAGGCVARGGNCTSDDKWLTSAMRMGPPIQTMLNPNAGDLYGARLALRLYDPPDGE